MARILWHSNSPLMGGGYGVQTALAVPALAELGHEVTISAFGGGAYSAPTTWNGFQVMATGQRAFGNGVLAEHARRIKADLVIILCDAWVIEPYQLGGLRVAPWIPIDTCPLSSLDDRWLDLAKEAGADIRPIAMSRHGQAQLEAAGHSCVFVPHAIDTEVFRPPQDRHSLRRERGIPDEAFLIAMVAQNKGVPARKAFGQQFEAFARFRKKHPNSFLAVHSVAQTSDGLDLPLISAALGVQDAVKFTDPYALDTGMCDQAFLADLYGCADLTTLCSMAEGFGIPIIESMACGTPVAATRASAMTELVPSGAGWLVNGDRWWNNTHSSWWVNPSVNEIALAYERAFNALRTKRTQIRESARRNACSYDIKLVAKEYWNSALVDLLG